MKLSRRAQRMQRHYHRMDKQGGLNLVSLMDIFTILVFFLMVNSSDVKVLQQDKSVQLPVSVAKQQAKETIIITVSGNNILVQGRTVASIDSLPAEGIIEGLKSELDYQSEKNGQLAGSDASSINESNDVSQAQQGRSVTLVADKSTPYKLLKRIMATSTEANYTHISLAVNKKIAGKKS